MLRKSALLLKVITIKTVKTLRKYTFSMPSREQEIAEQIINSMLS